MLLQEHCANGIANHKVNITMPEVTHILFSKRRKHILEKESIFCILPTFFM